MPDLPDNKFSGTNLEPAHADAYLSSPAEQLPQSPPTWLGKLELIISTMIFVAAPFLGLALTLTMRMSPARHPAAAGQTTLAKSSPAAKPLVPKKEKTIVSSPNSGSVSRLAMLLGVLVLFAGIRTLIRFKEKLRLASWWEPPPSQPPPWTLLDCLKPLVLMFDLVLLLQVANILWSGAVTGSGGDRQQFAIMFDLGIKFVLFLYMLLIVAARGGWTGLVSRGIIKRGRIFWTAALAYLGFIPVYLLLNVINNFAVFFLPELISGEKTQLQPQAPVQLLLDSNLSPPVLLLFLLHVAMGAPLVEELFFRGLLYGGLRQVCSWRIAALTSGVLFGAMHGDPQRLLLLTGLGVFLAILRERTQTLWVPILVHGLFNTVMLLLLFSTRFTE